ncbi:hypothetical protein D3C84_1250460 [compost metagenome]
MHQSAYQSSSSGWPAALAAASALSSAAGVVMVCQSLALLAWEVAPVLAIPA